MGKGKGKNKIWTLEKETQRYWKKEKKKRIIGVVGEAYARKEEKKIYI